MNQHINYTPTGSEDVHACGLQFDSADVGVTTYVPTDTVAATRAAEVLTILRVDGTYDVEIARQDGVELLSNQTITGGSFTVPTSTSPVLKVVTHRKA